MIRFLKRLFMGKPERHGTIFLEITETSAGNANSVICLNGNTWSQTPAGPRRSRTRSDASMAVDELIHAMRRGVIVKVRGVK